MYKHVFMTTGFIKITVTTPIKLQKITENIPNEQKQVLKRPLLIGHANALLFSDGTNPKYFDCTLREPPLRICRDPYIAKLLSLSKMFKFAHSCSVVSNTKQ